VISVLSVNTNKGFIAYFETAKALYQAGYYKGLQVLVCYKQGIFI